MIIKIIALVVPAITAIGIAIYQAKVSRQKTIDKRKSQSNLEIWEALNNLRIYYDTGLINEVQTTGTFNSKPLLEFRGLIKKSKYNIGTETFDKLDEFETFVSENTLTNIFNPMRIYLEKKKELDLDDKNKIEFGVNANRQKILNYIELFMIENKKILQ